MDPFAQSVWFRSGWTLQELLAPLVVIFQSQNWQVIGQKGKNGYTESQIEPTQSPPLRSAIAAITGIPEPVLHSYSRSKSLTPEEKLAWISGRTTTKGEDMYYSLLGIFGVTMSVLYSEGVMKARQSLLQKIAVSMDRFREIAAWLSPPDPWTNHTSARQRHQLDTGKWLLESFEYTRWKAGDIDHLWLCGKAGCGKTVLCSTVIEDIRAYCKTTPNSAHAVFYFSFSDYQKRNYKSLLRSLVVQLGWKELGLSTLVQAYKKPNKNVPGLEELEEVLVASIGSFDKVFILLDALDKCPETSDAQQVMLAGLEHLSSACNIRILATSRETGGICGTMESLGATTISIAKDSVDADIHKWVSGQLLRDRKRFQLDLATKALIEETISQRVDGMFRWAYCQLQELKKLKSTRPRYVREALLSLPPTLDKTYERMLTVFGPMFRKEAHTVLRWLVFAWSPPTLDELAEAAIIDPSKDAEVNLDVDNREGSSTDILNILSGLVMAQRTRDENLDDDDDDDDDDSDWSNDGSNDDHADVSSRAFRNRPFHQLIRATTKVRLAHFSVKEYLESKRIVGNDAREFHLGTGKDHRFLAQSCLTYLKYYSTDDEKSSTIHDLSTYSLLEYSAKSWYYHSTLQECGDLGLEVALLTSSPLRYDWLLVHDLYNPYGIHIPFQGIRDTGSSLYYASITGLDLVVQMLLNAGVGVDAAGEDLNQSLVAASYKCNGKIVQMLINAGAGVNAQGGVYHNALQAASWQSRREIVRMLINAGADVNAQGGEYVNALQAASWSGEDKIVQMLLDNGADVNAQGGCFDNALRAASCGGHKKVVHILVYTGANVDTKEGKSDSALQMASWLGLEDVVQILLNVCTKVNAQGGHFGNALQAASSRGHSRVVRMLIEGGPDVDSRGGCYGNALQAASRRGHSRVAEMLKAKGALMQPADCP